MRPGLFTLALLVLLGSVAPSARGQRTGSSGADRDALSAVAQLEAMGAAGLALEGPIDPARYVVGPGDVFAVTLDVAQGAASIPVSADGMLLLPGASGVRVAGLTLAEAQRDALAALRRVYRNVGLDVALVQPRQFFVHVTGAVARPGRYLAAPVARASSVVMMALGAPDSLGFKLANPSFQPALRSIALRHADGTSETLDLRRYYATGDTRHDPYLRDGDVLMIPAYDPATHAVTVSGAVASPGAYEHRDDDTIASVLRLAADEATLRRSPGVRLTRLGPDGTPEVSMRSMREVLDGRALLRVQPQDHLHVNASNEAQGQAVIEGLVAYPGAYPVRPGTTTVRDLLTLAGGAQADALTRAALLVRATSPADPTAGLPPRARVLPVAGSPVDSLRLLTLLRASPLPAAEQNLLRQDWALQRVRRLDLDADASTLLQNGDRLIVPRDEQAVYVFGEVLQPGSISLSAGTSAMDYARAAGGLTTRADQIVVIDGLTDRYDMRRDAPVASGDLIYVTSTDPIAVSVEAQRLGFDAERLALERERYRSERASRRNSFVIQTLGLAASVVTTVLLIRSQDQGSDSN